LVRREAKMEILVRIRLLPAVFLALVVSWSSFGQTYTIYTIAGNGTHGFSGDNGPVTARGARRNSRVYGPMNLFDGRCAVGGSTRD
jgi:hypothetical protein